ncbi:MAG TPA: TRAFs-binding domain-containing protein [Vicinamibacterales bacterium]|nr:TRAFs-binding domain-containing protein [Vicinamibacterales bacterium]
MPKKCFVVMGFGEKTDFATGRVLDLDKTYRIIIKKAVEQAGVECIRADDIIHSGEIDKPMYELLLEADIVIADLSTSNANAIYELGVRHGLRPHTTIVIAEKQFKFPFDLGHLLIRPYEHLGKGIDAEEADRVRDDLVKAINTLLAKPDVDSPVYTFLPGLKEWNAGVAPIVAAAAAAPAPPAAAAPAPAAGPAPSDETASVLLDAFRDARASSNWVSAMKYLARLLERRPADEYLKQQLALATYKSKKPDVATALSNAKTILEGLKPHGTSDPETLGLWGAVHKRLWETGKDQRDLDEAIWAHGKGFYVKDDHYNGINFAFLLNVRASVSQPREALADVVTAERVRRRVAAICTDLLSKPITDDQGNVDKEETFWVKASRVEALLGSGDTAKAAAERAAIASEAPEAWMVDTMNEQLGKLDALLAATSLPT